MSYEHPTKPLNLIFLGPQGAGKGTQSLLLTERFGWKRITSGDIFRDLAKQDNAFGRWIKFLLDDGQLVSDELTIELIRDTIRGVPRAVGILFDGFPRTVNQAMRLQQILTEEDRERLKVIYLDVSKPVSYDRLGHRRVCVKCHTPYSADEQHLTCCTRCGGEIHRRSDETLEAIEKRLEQYYEQTVPVVDYYRTEGILERIDAEKSVADVTTQILSKLP